MTMRKFLHINKIALFCVIIVFNNMNGAHGQGEIEQSIVHYGQQGMDYAQQQLEPMVADAQEVGRIAHNEVINPLLSRARSALPYVSAAALAGYGLYNIKDINLQNKLYGALPAASILLSSYLAQSQLFEQRKDQDNPRASNWNYAWPTLGLITLGALSGSCRDSWSNMPYYLALTAGLNIPGIIKSFSNIHKERTADERKAWMLEQERQRLAADSASNLLRRPDILDIPTDQIERALQDLKNGGQVPGTKKSRWLEFKDHLTIADANNLLKVLAKVNTERDYVHRYQMTQDLDKILMIEPGNYSLGNQFNVVNQEVFDNLLPQFGGENIEQVKQKVLEKDFVTLFDALSAYRKKIEREGSAFGGFERFIKNNVQSIRNFIQIVQHRAPMKSAMQSSEDTKLIAFLQKYLDEFTVKSAKRSEGKIVAQKTPADAATHVWAVLSQNASTNPSDIARSLSIDEFNQIMHDLMIVQKNNQSILDYGLPQASKNVSDFLTGLRVRSMSAYKNDFDAPEHMSLYDIRQLDHMLDGAINKLNPVKEYYNDFSTTDLDREIESLTGKISAYGTPMAIRFMPQSVQDQIKKEQEPLNQDLGKMLRDRLDAIRDNGPKDETAEQKKERIARLDQELEKLYNYYQYNVPKNRPHFASRFRLLLNELRRQRDEAQQQGARLAVITQKVKEEKKLKSKTD